jgi:RNA polymerase sigma factor (TIGR02999 family)
MENQDNPSLTLLLNRAAKGDRHAIEELISKAYPDLRQIAASRLRHERANHTLQPTALVNEAYVRLFGSQLVNWENRAQFFAIMAKHMRFILVEHARKKSNHPRIVISLDDTGQEQVQGIAVKSEEDLIVLHDLLTRLEEQLPRAAQAVELRFFGGLTLKQIAKVQRIDVATVKRDWAFARSWLYSQMVSK